MMEAEKIEGKEKKGKKGEGGEKSASNRTNLDQLLDAATPSTDKEKRKGKERRGRGIEKKKKKKKRKDSGYGTLHRFVANNERCGERGGKYPWEKKRGEKQRALI